MVWAQLAYFVITTIISIALSPKPPKPKPAALEDFDIPVAEEDRPIPVVFGKVQVTGPNVLWYGDLDSSKIKKSSLFGSSTIGFRYYMGLHFGICHGPVDELSEILIGEKLAWSGSITSNGSALINQPKLFGGDKKEGGVYGTFDVMFGEDNQSPNEYLDTVVDKNPAYRGIFGVVWTRKQGQRSNETIRGIVVGKLGKQGLIGNTPYPKPWSFVVSRFLKGWEGGEAWYPEKLIIDDEEFNAAHMVYQCITDTEWGMGYPSSSIDEDNFEEVADQLFEEGFGLRLLWNRQTTIEEFITIILDHIGADLNFNRITGKYQIKLLRGDYEAEDLDLYDENTIKAVTSFQRQLWGETVNEVTVVYTDPSSYGESPVTVHDLANIQAQSATINKKLTYTGIYSRDLAAKVAIRELTNVSTPLAKISFDINRAFWNKVRGDVFKLSWARLGLSGVVFRVLSSRGGTLKDSTISVEAIEDIFGLPASVYVQPQAPESPASPLDPPDLESDNTSSVLNSGISTPPGSPSNGDRYLIPLSPPASGDWEGLEGTVVEWDEDEGIWVPVELTPGQLIYDETSGSHIGVDNDGEPISAPWTPAIPPMAEDTSPDDEDYLVIWKDGAQSYRKVAWSTLVSGGSADPVLPICLADIWIGVQGGASGTPSFSADGRNWFVQESDDAPAGQVIWGSDSRYHGISGQQLGRSDTRNFFRDWTYVHLTNFPIAGFSGGVAWSAIAELDGALYAWASFATAADYPLIVTSTDEGVTWAEVGENDLPEDFRLIQLFYSEDLEEFVAIGHLEEEVSPGVFEYRPRVYSSADLLAWTLVEEIADTPATDNWSVKNAFQNGSVILVGMANNSTTYGVLAISEDGGATWTLEDDWPERRGITGLTHDGTRYYVSGRDWVARSTNLSDWLVEFDIFGLEEDTVLFGKDGTVVIALSTPSTFRSAWTSDGITFTPMEVLPRKNRADLVSIDDSGLGTSAKTVQEFIELPGGAGGAALRTLGAVWVRASAIATPVNDVLVRCPFDGEIEKVTIGTIGGTGSCVIDIRKDAHANFPPGSGDSICGGNFPEISSGISFEGSSLSGWDTSISEGDWLSFHLTSSSTFTYIVIELFIRES